MEYMFLRIQTEAGANVALNGESSLAGHVKGH